MLTENSSSSKNKKSLYLAKCEPAVVAVRYESLIVTFLIFAETTNAAFQLQNITTAYYDAVGGTNLYQNRISTGEFDTMNAVTIVVNNCTFICELIKFAIVKIVDSRRP